MLDFLRMLCSLREGLVRSRRLLLHRWRVQVVDKNTTGDRLALGGHLCDSVRVGVFLLRDVVKLQAPELSFQFSDFLAVCIHKGTLAVGVFHDLVNYQF